MHIIPNFYIQQFGENFMKIRTKILKLQMHEHLHTNVKENIYIFMQFFIVIMVAIKATDMLQLYPANF